MCHLPDYRKVPVLNRNTSFAYLSGSSKMQTIVPVHNMVLCENCTNGLYSFRRTYLFAVKQVTIKKPMNKLMSIGHLC